MTSSHSHGPAPRRISTQLYLFCLVAAVVVPLLVFAGFLLTRYAAQERARFAQDATQIARQVAMIVDGELEGMVALLRGLGTSQALARDDYTEFHAEARRLIEGTDETIILRGMDSRQYVNAARPLGSVLPRAVPIGAIERAAYDSGRPVVTDVYSAPSDRQVRIAVAIPIMRDGAPKYALGITLPTSRLRDVLKPAVPPGWIVGVGDRKGVYVTHSTRHDSVTGKPGVAEYMARATGRSGTFVGENFQGDVLLAGYYRSDFSDWLVAANIPQEVVEGPLRRSLAALVAYGAGALALSALLAYLFGRGFTAASAGLSHRAAALGEGRPVLPMDTRIAEVAVVGDALAAAAEAIRERTRTLAERTHELETVLATVPAAVWFTYDPQMRELSPNRFAAELMRVPVDEARSFTTPGSGLDHVRLMKDGRVLRPEDMPLRRVMRGEQVVDEEYSFHFTDGTSRTLLTSATALRSEDGAVVGAVSVSLDISERKRSDVQRQLLINELNHRVKNTLATVQSIALQTLRGAASTAEARDALSDRLVALAKVHDVLTRESWEGADLRDIVANATEPHGGAERFSLDGPPVWLSPALSLSLSLALHELATNAAKYGALSHEGGRVTIAWQVAEARLTLRWAESDGPPVKPPTREGFGSRLIRSLSAEIGATATVDYAPQGVICVIEAPLQPRT